MSIHRKTTASDESAPTRGTLLNRLRNLDDQQSWQEFFETYSRLISNVAMKAGLSPVEAQEVVQETMIESARKLPAFTYDPAKDSFKGWLLHITRYRIADQFRKRGERSGPDSDPAKAMSEPLDLDWFRLWDIEWEENLLHKALERVKSMVKPEHYEVYHLHVLKGQSASDVSRALGVHITRVYLIKHRLTKLVTAAVQELKSSGAG